MFSTAFVPQGGKSLKESKGASNDTINRQTGNDDNERKTGGRREEEEEEEEEEEKGSSGLRTASQSNMNSDGFDR